MKSMTLIGTNFSYSSTYFSSSKNPKSQIIADELNVCFLFRMTSAKVKQIKKNEK